MSVAEWNDTYGIHHWRILWNSYRKLAWVRFEPTTTEFRSDAVTDRAIWRWVQPALRANFAQLLQFHRMFSVRFYFGYCLRQSSRLFNYLNQNFLEVITECREHLYIYININVIYKHIYIYIYIYIHIYYIYVYVYVYIYINIYK